MGWHWLGFSLLCLLLNLSVLGWSASNSARHVVLISVDGLAAFHLDNPDLELPHIRALAARGVWARGVKGVFPSVTHPSHTTILTGVQPRIHGVIGNRLSNRVTGETFHVTNLPHSVSVKVPTLFDAAKNKGMTTASFFWPESWQDAAIDFNIPEVFNAEGRADISAAPPDFLEQLRQAGVPIDLYYKWYGNEVLMGGADVVLTQAAAQVLREHQPQLLAIHLLATDVVQHAWGPDHYLSQAALSHADYCVGLLVDAAAEAGILEQTVFIVTADHGFQTVRFELNVAPVFKPLGNRIKLHPGGWTTFVELQPSFSIKRDQELLDAAFAQALQLDGVSRLVRPAQFHDLGYPRYEEDPHVAGQYMLIGDIDTLLVAEPGDPSTARRPKPQPYHSHGYLPEHPRMRPAFVAAGPGIRRGLRLEMIEQLDIAPTVAALLGLNPVGDSNRVLTPALTRHTTAR